MMPITSYCGGPYHSITKLSKIFFRNLWRILENRFKEIIINDTMLRHRNENYIVAVDKFDADGGGLMVAFKKYLIYWTATKIFWIINNCCSRSIVRKCCKVSAKQPLISIIPRTVCYFELNTYSWIGDMTKWKGGDVEINSCIISWWSVSCWIKLWKCR